MKSVGFIGYGELGRQIAAMVLTKEPRLEAQYFDDIAHSQGLSGAFPMTSCFEEKFQDTAFFVCLGYKHLKKNSRSLSA